MVLLIIIKLTPKVIFTGVVDFLKGHGDAP
jgi:hypothetical protein